MDTSEPRLAAVGAAIKRHRMNGNLSQEALARRAGIPLRNYQKLESGQNPTLTTLLRIADALGVTVSTLLEGIATVEPPIAEPEPPPARTKRRSR
jgi:transcriptional regulator with XRE-family HTH domain